MEHRIDVIRPAFKGRRLKTALHQCFKKPAGDQGLAVANFKIREGMPIGCKVTLRGEKMYEFADRLINLAIPRVRDFRGVNPNAFDGRGNYALGIKEQLIFPEVEYDKVDKVRGMDIIFVTTAKTDEEARELLTQFNMPFAK